MELYFDNSVYGFIDDANEARAVRGWLNGSRYRVQSSDEVNLGEALRTPDPETRVSRLKTITTVGPRPSYPVDLIAAEELLGEVRRTRPNWIADYPTLKSKVDYLRQRRAAIWQRVKDDPTFVPPTARLVLPLLRRIVGENVAAQKARRRVQLQKARRQFNIHIPELAPIFAKYSEIEQYCRYQAEVEWRYLLTDPKTASAEIDWLMPHLNAEAMSAGSEWPKFWIAEADLSAMPVTHTSTLVEYFQAERPITAGNTFDRIHASYLSTHDRVVTADRDFYDALVFVKEQLPQLRGTPTLIDRKESGSALAELRKALRGGR